MQSFVSRFFKKKEKNKNPEKPTSNQAKVLTVDTETSQITLPFIPNELQNIVVIALDVRRSKKGFKEFSKLSVAEKIKQLAEHTHNAWELANHTHPNADLIVIAWRETAITDVDAHKSISVSQKKLMNATFRELSKNCPKLFIIAGSVVVRQQGGVDKLDMVQRAYEKQELFTYVESIKNGGGSELKNYANTALSKKLVSGEEVTIFKNKLYAFYNGKVFSYGKVTPWKEEFTNEVLDINLKDALFKPGASRPLKSNDAIFPMNKTINFGFEICREHFLELLFQAYKDRSISAEILIVIADSIPFDTTSRSFLKKTKQAALYIDSQNPPALILPPKSNKSEDKLALTFYIYNIFEAVPSLVSTEPCYPFQYQLQDYLAAALEKFADNRKVTEQIKELFSIVAGLNPNPFLDNGSYHKILILFIEKYQQLDRLNEAEIDRLNMEQVIKDLCDIILATAQKQLPERQYDWLKSEVKFEKNNFNPFEKFQHQLFGQPLVTPKITPPKKLDEGDGLEYPEGDAETFKQDEGDGLEHPESYTLALINDGPDMALYIAISLERLDLVEDALKEGANPFAVTNTEEPYTAYEFAKIIGFNEILEIFENTSIRHSNK